MAFTVNLAPLSLRSPEITAGNNSSLKSGISFTKKRQMLAFAANNSTEEPPTIKPEIQLEFIAPKAGGDGKYPVDRAAAVSGDKLLRTIMEDNKLELYGTYGKLMNCGGGGSCGTCIVEVVEGKELLNERTNTELKYLKKKPDSWRLACQTIVGNKENSGKVVIQRLPQRKK
ncbi:photosynthetic NDH subunit of subcomplex B 3, chloroplastic isoform X2 [Cynara cardunculus var. scolymus]|uniref:photosynthetic NDH subunit of subcomplex B 3, chloroplastic isoform X2 n=1 Tax=Cynara cardunculus var. scolymus TaxID=59895 RepID=UPI000D6252B4|nr:photosynthetic NDH subunit of subcomplex B 3, chloroplastic isoform X2 [Cynara cardunculus var. scolymus]